ncbi:MAG: DUF2934 domain-containing protein [Chloroflexota bacterium]|nr:DUF2934 domain-containing protein [Chloroflexota bacterium]
MPTEEQIRELAYYLWEQAGKPEGNDQDYYFKARQALEEREAAEKRASSTPPAAPSKPALPSPSRRAPRRRK